MGQPHWLNARPPFRPLPDGKIVSLTATSAGGKTGSNNSSNRHPRNQSGRHRRGICFSGSSRERMAAAGFLAHGELASTTPYLICRGASKTGISLSAARLEGGRAERCPTKRRAADKDGGQPARL